MKQVTKIIDMDVRMRVRRQIDEQTASIIRGEVEDFIWFSVLQKVGRSIKDAIVNTNITEFTYRRGRVHPNEVSYRRN